MSHEVFMRRCLELAEAGRGVVAPNPMVGCVITKGDTILAEGFHAEYGKPHAEADALAKITNQGALAGATLYCNLEPCAHTGKTPPCVNAILASQISTVVIGTRDTNAQAAGGASLLRDGGKTVIEGVLESECRQFNARFFTFHEKKRPYVILKWAQTSDGFIARSDYSSKWISGEESRTLVHRWRSEEAAVLVGTMTAIQDNPHLTARIPKGKNPVRVVIDRTQQIPTSFHVFDESAQTLLFNEVENYDYPAATLIKIDFSGDVVGQILSHLYDRSIQSLIVEGGAKTIQSVIDRDLWDEARVFISPVRFGEGIPAPRLPSVPSHNSSVEGDLLKVYYRPS